MKLAAVAVVAAALASTAAAARHVVESASEGTVEAELSYDFKAPYTFTHAHVAIKRSGKVVSDEKLTPLTSYSEVVPARYFDHQKSVAIRNLDSDVELEIVLDLYSGGAHCCWYTMVYRYSAATDAYLSARHIWGNATYRSFDLNHDALPEFVSGDDRFAYEFTSFGGSSFPVEIWSYRAGRFVDVTRRFRSRIRLDARRQWRWALSKQRRGDNAGFLAAWAADQCLLRHSASAFSQLSVLRRQRRIGVDPVGDRTVGRYLRHLRRFLHRTGYLR